MKPSGIGGMAVMEGVMMKNKEKYAVAVRKPDKEIAIEVKTHKDISEKVKLFKLPIFRGMMAFVDSLVIGMKVLNYSASFFDEVDDKAQTDPKNRKKKAGTENKAAITEDGAATAHREQQIQEEAAASELKKDKDNTFLMAIAVLISIVISVALFMVLPVLITNLFSKLISSNIIISTIEGLVRLAIFIGYVILASRMNEIKRVFMYHGAEHKTINCLENGLELTVKNVKRQSKQHKRCGTSFMLLVILISLLFFLFLPSMNLLGRVLSRIILVPFIAGVSYEFIRIAGKSENKVVEVLSKPGLWMQGLTTKEPDDSMIEVAIKSVEAVFDWRAFLSDGKTASKNKSESKKAEYKKTVAEKKEKKEPELQSEDRETRSHGRNQVAEAQEASKVKESVSIGRNKGLAPIKLRSDLAPIEEEEDDDILKALDKFFDDRQSKSE
jgi:uncharacterized protein YqhQ